METENKNSMNMFNRELDAAQKRISELEDRSEESIQKETW